MIDFKQKRETLDLAIITDRESGLPLLKEGQKILDIILTYLPLPFTIAEYGCGKKASIIIRKLIKIGIPAYAIKRGMVMEKDMSAIMLAQEDARKRPHALVAPNPLYHPKDFHQEALLRMLEHDGVRVESDYSIIKTGDYTLHHIKEVQFKKARSHIFAIIIFWDGAQNKPFELAMDPTLNAYEPFPVGEMRELLNDDDALIFTAPLTVGFRLDPRYLTDGQKEELKTFKNGSKDEISLIRHLNKAEKGSIGDPGVWTYANNLVEGHDHDQKQKKLTGNGDVLRDAIGIMLEARSNLWGEVVQHRHHLEKLIAELNLNDIAAEDAEWSEKMLEPLAVVENTIAYFRAARQLASWYKKGLTLQDILGEKSCLKKLAGLGMRLRQRIEDAAAASEDESGKIDARAFNGRFNNTFLESIRQMNGAGLKVFVDKVGNLHGLLFPTTTDLGNGLKQNLKAFTKRAICICSHLDSVKDAGKYDGRLGVLSGIEVAHVLTDLKEYFNLPFPNTNQGALPHLLMVTAFNGEEMNFTGEGVSMPGSAAVAGRATVEQIHKMTNPEGETFRDKLVELLLLLREEQTKSGLLLANDFSGCKTDGELLEACADPSDFFTPFTYERHIEQGPVLDELGIPLALVDTIMGIHQEDFTVEGIRAEQGALAINHRLRQLALDSKDEIRITVGIMDGSLGYRVPKEVGFALRCQLFGEKNHAGATRLEDRYDPGVAAARLAGYFIGEVEALNEKNGTDYRPCVGGVELQPGTNRNVIPESTALTLAIESPPISEEIMQKLLVKLQSWILLDLSGKVKNGGEGIQAFNIEPIGFISACNMTKFSIDLRAADKAAIADFLKQARAAINTVASDLGLKITSDLQQELQPYQLAESGQVLQLERSFGGSHNPNEAQLEADLLRGTLLQLTVVREFLQLGSLEHFNLFEFVEQYIPQAWKVAEHPFVSGALHDTCNIAAKLDPRCQSSDVTGLASGRRHQNSNF